MIDPFPLSKTHSFRGGPDFPAVKWPARLLFATLIFLVGWFYWWTAQPFYHGGVLVQESQEYYNSLGRGLLKGHLYLDTPIDPTLAQMKNPLDPVERGDHGLHDASYFKNKYYLYFGISPELLLFLPVHFLTGLYISESFASVVFSWIGFLLSLALLWEVKQHFFPKSSLAILSGLILALGLATMVPSLLRRPSVWEVPITCAYACAMAALLFFAKALLGRQRRFWLALASLAMGLTVGARPVYFFACAALLLPLVYWVSEYGGWRRAWRKREWWQLIAAAVVPLACCGAGLAVYNYLRFSSIAEFGQRYQMAGDEVSKLKLFSWNYPCYGFRVYLLARASLTPYFTFFSVISAPKPPAGHLGLEDPYGILPNIPFVFLALGLLAMGRPKTGSIDLAGLKRISMIVVTLGGLTAAVVFSFGGISNRYEVDFAPTMIVLAALGTLVGVNLSCFRGYLRLIGGAIITVLIAFSVTFNVLISVQHNDLLRDEQPKLYSRVAHSLNYFSYGWDRLTGVQYGPLELKLTFPQVPADRYEALVATGAALRADYVWVHYLNENSLEFGFEHTNHGRATSRLFHYTPGETQTLRVDLGSLYPPPAHPFFDRFSSRQAEAIQRTLRLTLNNEVVLQGVEEFYDANSHWPSIGDVGDRPGFRQNFSGKIISVRRLEGAFPEPAPIAYGPIRMVVKFPIFSEARSEPLVSSGHSGAGDLFFVRYLNDHQVIFGHDDWGGGAVMGEPVAVDFSFNHTIEIDYGGLYPAEGAAGWNAPRNVVRSIVKMDGKTVLDRAAPFHFSTPDDVVVGKNAIQASSAFPLFSGSLIKYDRLSTRLMPAQ